MTDWVTFDHSQAIEDEQAGAQRPAGHALALREHGADHEYNRKYLIIRTTAIIPK